MRPGMGEAGSGRPRTSTTPRRSEEHTSELQSQSNIVCRLLLEKKKQRASCSSLPPSPTRLPATSEHIQTTNARHNSPKPLSEPHLALQLPTTLAANASPLRPSV